MKRVKRDMVETEELDQNITDFIGQLNSPSMRAILIKFFVAETCSKSFKNADSITVQWSHGSVYSGFRKHGSVAVWYSGEQSSVIDPFLSPLLLLLTGTEIIPEQLIWRTALHLLLSLCNCPVHNPLVLLIPGHVANRVKVCTQNLNLWTGSALTTSIWNFTT